MNNDGPTQEQGGNALSSRRVLLSGWGRSPRSSAELFTVRKTGDAAALLRQACGSGHDAERASVLARGLGRSYGDSAQNAGGNVLDMTAMAGIRSLDLDAGTVTAEAGLSLDALIRAVLPLGYFVPVTPGTRFVTIGGAIAADIHGKNHHADGSFQDHLLAFTLLTADGQEMCVTGDSQPDVFAATAGGMGLTGVVTEATLRLLPVETAYMRVDTERTSNLDETMERMVTGDAGYRYSVAWTDSLARGNSLGRSVLMRANHAAAAELPAKALGRPLGFKEGIGLPIPPWMPGGLLRHSTMAIFNEAFYRRAPIRETARIQSMATYFHPLDRLRNWNRIYGKRGLVQYQFVVPDGEEGALRLAFEMLSAAGVPSFLTVLKRFGPGHGMLSFPAKGWTLTLDIPGGVSGLDELLDDLDEVVISAGGRVYLAKDSRLRPAALAAMYPELERWKAVRARLDPRGLLRSDLARRLDLV